MPSLPAGKFSTFADPFGRTRPNLQFFPALLCPSLHHPHMVLTTFEELKPKLTIEKSSRLMQKFRKKELIEVECGTATCGWPEGERLLPRCFAYSARVAFFRNFAPRGGIEVGG